MLLFFVIAFTTFDYALIPYPNSQVLERDILYYDSLSSDRIFFRPIVKEVDNLNISAGFTDYFWDLSTIYFSVLYKNFSFGVFSLNSGSIEVVDSTGLKTGESFTPVHMGFVFAPSLSFFNLWNIEKGVSIKFLYVKLRNFSSFALVFDFSFMKEFKDLFLPLKSSFDIRNIGFATNKDASLPPYEFSLSLSSYLGNFYYGTGISYEEELFSFRLNGRYIINKNFQLIAGFNSRTKEITENEGFHALITGFAAGFILSFKNLKLSYSFVPSGVFQDIHKIDLSINF